MMDILITSKLTSILKKYTCPTFRVTGFIENEVDLNGYSGWESMTWDNLKQLDKSPLVQSELILIHLSCRRYSR